MIISDSAAGFNGATDTIARNLMARLDAAYPVFQGLWTVAVNEAGGVITVTNAALGHHNGFVMHISLIDSEGRKVVSMAGELLERYRISRSQRVREVVNDLGQAQRDFRGRLVADA